MDSVMGFIIAEAESLFEYYLWRTSYFFLTLGCTNFGPNQSDTPLFWGCGMIFFEFDNFLGRLNEVTTV